MKAQTGGFQPTRHKLRPSSAPDTARSESADENIIMGFVSIGTLA